MKKLLLAVFLFSFSTGFLAAQTPCSPNLLYADSTAGVYPRPYDPVLSPSGGINAQAVIGEPYQFDFTIVIGDTLTIGTFSFPLDSIWVYTVSGLPTGITHICHDTCTFLKNTISCTTIYGTPTSGNTPGDFPLTITGKAFINGSSLPLPLEFPNASIAPGTYTLELLPEGSTNSGEALAEQVSLTTMPNPASGMIQIQINSNVNDKFSLEVLDLLGKPVYQNNVELTQGAQTVELDGSQFPNGIYLLTLQHKIGVIAHKIIIQH